MRIYCPKCSSSFQVVESVEDSAHSCPACGHTFERTSPEELYTSGLAGFLRLVAVLGLVGSLLFVCFAFRADSVLPLFIAGVSPVTALVLFALAACLDRLDDIRRALRRRDDDQ